MSYPSDGGPAFPILDNFDENGYRRDPISFGMSLRDWFATHAPKEKWDWFEPVMTTEKPKHPGDVGPNTFQEYRQSVHLWDHEYSKQREIQWPWFYADNMIKERIK